MAKIKLFGGWQYRVRHQSDRLNCAMSFSIYLPPQAEHQAVPCLYWLSGLTCTDENVMQKSGIQRIAAELGMAIVAPDTSPRGDDVADAEGRYDLGLGAGFYVNALQQPWQAHYQMYSYIVDELPALVEQQFNVSAQRAISGHSMGGHGALVIGLRNSQRFSSVSAFSPIVNPMKWPWGQQAFSTYLGDDTSNWKLYDSCELLKQQSSVVPVLIDQGLDDEFLQQQLLTQHLCDSAEAVSYPLTVRLHADYDHSYYFVASFIEQHLHFHMQHF